VIKAIVTSRILTRLTFTGGVLVLAALISMLPVSGQSGRTQDPTRKKVKPVPPDPLPRPRTIEQPKNEDGTIRINSDLVTVVTTVGAQRWRFAGGQSRSYRLRGS
jgi:hypothetical protein